ncbi:MAG: flagellar hook-associated protein FlgK [Burkholderiaceae bacterium]
MSLLSIGNSALQAAYVALRTSSHNVGNALVPGYKRQEAIFGSLGGQFLGGQYVGNGTEIVDVRRVYNEFLTGQAHSATATANQTAAYYNQIASVSKLFTNSESSVGGSIDDLFKSVQSLSQRPGDGASRQSLLSSANLMTGRFNELAGQVTSMGVGADKQLGQELDNVNRLAAQVADLNDRIALARGAGRSPNDLLDQRDQAVRELNGSVRVQVAEQDDGSINVFLANGQPLVTGKRSESLAVTRDPQDPGRLAVGVKIGGEVIALPASTIAGGTVAGILQFSTQDVPQAKNDLGRLAIAMAMKFNEQNKLGLTVSGQPGGDFFTLPAAHAFGHGGNSAGSAVAVSFADASQLVASDYEIAAVDDGMGGVAYEVTRLSDGKVFDPMAGPKLTVDGLEIDVAGAVGDRFTVQPYRDAATNISVAIKRPDEIAAAGPFEAKLPNDNQGSLTVGSIAPGAAYSPAALDASYQLSFTSATDYTLTRTLPDGTTSTSTGTYTAGSPIKFPGGELTLAGTPAVGDVVNFGKNQSTAGDGRNAIAMGQLADFGIGDSGKLGTLYSSIVARIGSDTAGAKMFAEAGLMVMKDAIGAEASVSGVNLDEEAAKLMLYQQQYSAAAKVVATGQALFDTVLSIGR